MLLGKFQQKLLLKALILVLQFSMVDSDKQSCYVTVAVQKYDLLHTDTVVYSMIYGRKCFQKLRRLLLIVKTHHPYFLQRYNYILFLVTAIILTW